MKLLPAADRERTPWKNGGGTTMEVAAFPPGAGFDDFGWRVSIAEVTRGGLFSTFPGIDRCLTVLDGRIALTIEGTGPVNLSPDTAPLEFSGDAETVATVISGPIVDLNVMTRRGKFVSRVTRHLFTRATTLELHATASIGIALSTFTVGRNSETHVLNARDAIILQDEARIDFSGAAGDFYWIEIFKS